MFSSKRTINTIGQPLNLAADRSNVPFKHLNVRSYDDNTGLFLLQADSGRGSCLGAVFTAPVMIGASDSTIERFKASLSIPLRPGSFIQIALLSHPDVSDYIAAYTKTKINAKGRLRDLTMRRAEMIASSAVSEGKSGAVLLNKKEIVVSITIPCAVSPSKEDISYSEETIIKIQESLRSAGLLLTQAKEKEYLSIIRTLFNMYSPNKNDVIDEYSPLREQVFGPTDSVKFENNYISFNDDMLFAKMLSVKNYPKMAGIGLMNLIVGDPFGSSNQISDPYFISTTIHYPDQVLKDGEIRRQHAWITNQAMGNMLNMIPLLGYKKHGFDTMIHEMDGNGAVFCEMNFTITLFSTDKEKLNGLAASVSTWASSIGFDLKEDRKILKALFYNLIPLNVSVDGIKNLFRFTTLAINHAVRFLPVLNDWEGSGDGGGSIFSSRRGSPVLFDNYDSSAGYNGIIYGGTGGGKSFVSQQLIVDCLAQSGKVWVIDQGYSYQKSCVINSGQFIELSDESDLCLNPFTYIKDIDEEMDLLKSVISKMAAPESGLGDYETSILEQCIKSVWDRLASSMTISDVADWLINQNELRIRDIGSQLFSFTRRGVYGRWFEGQNNIDFNNDYIVLELEGLASKPVLQQIVLILLFDKIGTEMSFDLNRRKLLLIDESWALINDVVIGPAIMSGYRKVRKNKGGVFLVTQNIADVSESENGRAILDNTEWQIILPQKAESISAAIKSGLLTMDDYGVRMLKSLHIIKNRYSELMIRRSAEDWGIVRFFTDRYTQILYSTSGWERSEVMDVAKNNGDVDAYIKQAVLDGR